jgi:hypothetical protein
MLLSSATFVRLPRVAAPTGQVCFIPISPPLPPTLSSSPLYQPTLTMPHLLSVRSSSVLYTPCPTGRLLSRMVLLGAVRSRGTLRPSLAAPVFSDAISFPSSVRISLHHSAPRTTTTYYCRGRPHSQGRDAGYYSLPG